MTTVAQILPKRPRPLEWLWDFLHEELAPYPGRGLLVARMTIAASIVMVLVMTFRIPFGAYGAVYALTLSRENPNATLKAVRIILISYALAVSDVLIGAIFFSGDPPLRVIWVAATLFIMFYALSALSNYTAAARFGYLIIITIPLWDQQVKVEIKVENTLWAVGAISLASLITAALELIFYKLKPWDDLTVSIAERLEQVNALLLTYANGTPGAASEKQIQRLSMLGTSRMRRNLLRSGYTPHYEERMGAVVAYVGRLVDLAANLAYFAPHIPDPDREYLRKLVETVEHIRLDLLNQRTPQKDYPGADLDSARTIPFLREMEVTVSLIAEVLRGAQPSAAFVPPSEPAEQRKGVFAPDAFSNIRHLQFGMRGGLAAFICYAAYNLMAWPEISTAVTTCLLTALTTIGSSRQKQVLRFGGALTGGAIAIASQILILPSFDSIASFLLLFVAVTIFAAWITTSGPRLSYFGTQVAVAFYLINLQEFKFQTSLAVARDRVVGILLGLLVMWLVFDQLGGVSAAVAMKRIFITNMRFLAQFTREPVSRDMKTAITKTYSLRETVNTTFDQFRQQADAVMMEFGPARERDLALRAQLLQWQYELRLVFLTRIALLKYRLNLPGFQLPRAVQAVEQESDNELAATLEGLADRLEGKTAALHDGFESAFEALERAVQESFSAEPSGSFASQLRTFLVLSERMHSLIRSLEQEIPDNPPKEYTAD
jgi:multidrug resistance protein MdtO